MCGSFTNKMADKTTSSTSKRKIESRYPSGKTGTQCRAWGCYNYTGTTSGIRYFTFPKEKERCDRWIINIRRQDMIHLKPENLKHARLCSEHFEDNQFVNPNDRTSSLKPTAIPTILNAPNPPKVLKSCRRPLLREIPTNVESENEDIRKPTKDMWTMTSETNDTVKNLNQKIKKLQMEIKNLRRRRVFTTSSRIFPSRQSVLNELRKHLSPIALKLVSDQIRVKGVKEKGMRWSDEVKSLALQLKGISAKAYKFLRKMFKLPCIRRLNKIVSDINIEEGFHPPVFKALEDMSKNMTEREKLVVLSYDEIALKANLSYNRSLDLIEGIQKFDRDTCIDLEKESINHSSVFMIRGVTGKWKQPIGYFSTAGVMNYKVLLTKILEAVRLVRNTGLEPIVFVCDQGSNNRAAVKELDVNVEKPWFLVDDIKVYFFFDTPHLLKNIRNNLRKHGFTHGSNSFSWKYIEKLYQLDVARPIRMVPRLTEKHIRLPAFSTMNVSLASQVLSHSVAAAISSLADFNYLPAEARETADFIDKFDKLFDCFNSNGLQSVKPLKCALKDGSPHLSFLMDMKEWIKGLTSKKESLPCVEGWKLNINALILLWQDSNIHSKLDFLMTRRINQDSLEHFFGSIRGKGGFRDNPESHQFRLTYRQALLDHLTIIGQNSNCESEDGHLLLKLSKLYQAKSTNTGPKDEVISSSHSSPDHVPNTETCLPLETVEEFSNLILDPLLEQPEENVTAYIAGYLARRAFSYFECSSCIDLWTAKDNILDDPIYSFIKSKKYSSTSNLILPSYVLFSFVMKMESVFRDRFPGINKLRNVCKEIIIILKENISDEIVCSSSCLNAQDFIFSLFSRVRIHHCVREFNRSRVKEKTKSRKLMKISHM